MIQVKRKTEKPEKQKDALEEVKTLREEIAKKDIIVADLQEQVNFVQGALDDLIFGGVL